MTVNLKSPGVLARLRQSDLWWSFTHQRSAVFAAVLLTVLIVSAFTAPLYAPHRPFDPAQLELWNAEIPPIWLEGGQWPIFWAPIPRARYPVGHPLWLAHLDPDRHRLGGIRAGDRHRHRAGRGLLWRFRRKRADAGGRHPAVDPHHPDRHSGQRHRAGAAAAQPARNRCRSGAGAGHRAERLGAICPHRARTDGGGTAQRNMCRRRSCSRCLRGASCSAISCPTR